jgi:hypothetical protein
MTSVGFEPQYYITRHVVFTTRPLARCWKPTATYSPYFCLACIIKIQNFQVTK